ncbi:MAG: hypothetical protein A3K83_01745 [Omnitrophica WOR_2 bacterium RBG_13_44_8b]|nr:MAG: hypothetical protein A3K83_01745 [Omnitrophica WOR_2 bacterium RBG_13_44_8b]
MIPELLARGYRVRVMVRRISPEYAELWPGVEAVVADALEIGGLRTALKDIDTAFYLIHSLRLGPKEFASTDLQAAKNFRQISEEMQVRRIIYLGGLGDIRNVLSSHLRSRAEVAQELRKGKAPVTVLRAAVIVGSGSASYEIIQHLIKKLRIVLIPPWAENRCQPIAIRDVIKYLVGVLENIDTAGKSFDIGGSDILTYEMMLKILAGLLKKKVFFLHVPLSSTRLYAYITSLITPVPNSITECLMESLTNEVICQDETINNFLHFKPLSYKEAVIRAMTREEQDRVYTRWSDAYPPAHEVALKLHELKEGPAYTASYSLIASKSATSLFNSICKIGGKEGWFHYSWLWRLRGTIDRILLGVGSARGRKSSGSLRINDVIDFWRVEDLQNNKKLLLRAEMKIPGRAWLEFNITKARGKQKLNITAYYDTRALLGKIYWYLCLPFHHFIFGNLIKEIEKRS